jgi:hypothetical protein
MSQNLP